VSVSGGPRAIQLPEAYTPYAWAATVAEVAARHGLDPVQVLKFDQNVPPLPGVAQVPLAESFATLNQYPPGAYRDLREAAAAYVGRDSDSEVGWEQVVIGAGADDLILLCARTFLAPGRSASIIPPTYSLYRIATLLAGPRRPPRPRCEPSLALQSREPDGHGHPAAELVELARRHPEAAVVVDEAYVEYGGETVVPWLDECPNLIVLRTMSKAFGYAALRVGFAVAAPATAAMLEERRAPAPVSAPAARIAAARFAIRATMSSPRSRSESGCAPRWRPPASTFPGRRQFRLVADRRRSRRATRAPGHHRPPLSRAFG